MNKHKPVTAILLSSLLLAGSAIAQINPTSPKNHADHADHMKKGPSGVARDGDVSSVNRRSDAAGSPGATDSSDRLAAPSGSSSSGATGLGLGGGARQPGTGLKSSGNAGSSASSGASSAGGSGGMGGGATGGTMR